jgi:hypothetical protein
VEKRTIYRQANYSNTSNRMLTHVASITRLLSPNLFVLIKLWFLSALFMCHQLVQSIRRCSVGCPVAGTFVA